MDITVVIHTLDDQENIVDCMESAKLLTDKIIVIDMESRDATVKLAKKSGAEIYFFPPASYVEPARNFGIGKASTKWVFLLDTDERLTPELAEEIKSALVNPQYSHFKINRKNIFSGVKWLKHGGWWPDQIIRLINKEHFKNWPKQIHSTPVISGSIRSLKNPL